MTTNLNWKSMSLALHALFLFVFMAVIGGCIDLNEDPGNTTDTTAPSISSTNPAGGVTGVAINTVVSTSFSETMDASTLTTETFTLSSGAGPVTGMVGYSGSTATFTPSANLNGATSYTATITTGAKDAAGNALTANYVWVFTTVTTPNTIAPSFAGLERASVLSTTTAGLAWSAATDDTTPVSGIRYFIYIATSSGGYNFSSPQFITAPGITTYEVSGLSPGQVYYFVVRAVDTSDNADSNTLEKAVALVEWQDPTGLATPVSLNQDTVQGSADEPSLAFNSGQIYAAWVEKSGAAGANQTYMGSLNGTSWTVDVSLNQDPSKSSKEATVAFKDATPYVAWSEHSTTNGDVYVKRKNGASWELLGGSLTISDPALSLIATIGHSPSVIPETSHIAFIQTDIAGVVQVFVKRWNDVTVTWDLLPGPNLVGSLNVDPANLAGLPVLAYVGTVPYVVWGEGPQNDLYVKRWNGAAWDIVGGKLNSGETNHHSWIAGNNQTVYVSWVEKNSSGVFQAYVAQWNGSVWSKLGGSLNVDTGNEAQNARVVAAADGTVYSAWTEKNGSGVFQLYARRWDGTSWILQGGSLNVDSTLGVTEPHIAVNGNIPYAAWVESNGVANGQVYVKTLP